MPKVTGPLFSVAASGVFKDQMEFRIVAGQTIVADRRNAPATRSAAQQQQSARFGAAVAAWKLATAGTKAAWKAAAASTGMTGYQLYLSEYQTQHVTPPDDPILP